MPAVVPHDASMVVSESADTMLRAACAYVGLGDDNGRKACARMGGCGSTNTDKHEVFAHVAVASL
eukprot:1371912-Pyramimonas_sp.AAC.1